MAVIQIENSLDRLVFNCDKHLGNLSGNLVAEHARAERAKWTMLTPAQRALQMTTFNPGFRMTPPLSQAEAYFKSELLTQKVLPDKFVQYALSRKAGTLADILELLFQRYMPSEPTARIDALTTLEIPLKSAKISG
eukprot:3652035-Amphidinium_carterae.2